MINFDKIKDTDSEIYDLIIKEYHRQDNELEMIASENRPSEAVLLAQASYHTLKYAEGYPNARYYAGCENIDATEQLAIDRACKLFNCNYANVQPHSGASANTAVQFALLRPGDTLMGMSLNSGGHLTHGAKPTFSGKNYKVVQYEVDKDTLEIDYEELQNMINKYEPHLFIAGASAYPREIDFAKIGRIIQHHNTMLYLSLSGESNDWGSDEELMEVYESKKCYYMVDMAHIAGLVAAGLHQSPIPYTDVVTTTTHKTLRGPRGGMILTNSEDMIKKINKAVFPGTQGGPLENIIAAKAICFKEALQPEYKEYMQKVVNNCKTLAESLKNEGIKLLTNGTDNHLILIDLRDRNISGQELEDRLKKIGIVTNKNAVPFDTKNKKTTSGLRIGTAAVTSRGLNEDDMASIAAFISICLTSEEVFNNKLVEMQNVVADICATHPLYKD